MIYRLIKRKRVQKLRDKLNFYDKNKYHRELLDQSKLIWTIFDKEYKEGDLIYWLGHDLVFGLIHGQTLIADKEAVESKDKLSFWKKIDDLDLSDF
jgi:hypothetical protein